ncbi:hypothetical protein G1H11_04960 [Phytoactinopolyspora alkaliphila]|uniref:Uncharacterized protein n=1 Tax=Phytoactinopolyspora alkaliphila TaxID=1783498 RepID=A0A6N9YI28_9ACTN|nr:hypothetical protein [Phytoactinopolyspora alkaliphila]NED94656.1 hypothetical protein [Phytoactinopolyspora alkaliphila]
MKLLEELPSTSTPRPSGKRVLATMTITFLVVVAASVAGYILVTGGGDDEQAETAPVQLSAWAEQASSTCHAVAEEHPLLSQGASAREDPDNVATVDAGVQSLLAGIDGLPPLLDEDEGDQVDEVLSSGASLGDTWRELAAADEVSGEQLASASELTTAYVSGLVELGADCAVLD